MVLVMHGDDGSGGGGGGDGNGGGDGDGGGDGGGEDSSARCMWLRQAKMFFVSSIAFPNQSPRKTSLDDFMVLRWVALLMLLCLQRYTWA